jgi:hypothetical protein
MSLNHIFFEANGFPAVHWDSERLAQNMAYNLRTGKKILDGHYSELKVFSDMISLTGPERIEANGYFREMDSHYPGSFFILNNRDTSAWLLSRERHNQGNFLLKNLTHMNTTDINLVRETWRSEKEAHEKEVREYFRGRQNFLEVDIDSNRIPERLSDFLGMEFDYSQWKIVNKTV